MVVGSPPDYTDYSEDTEDTEDVEDSERQDSEGVDIRKLDKIEMSNN